MSKHVMREGSDLIYITAYAPGDGDLSFVARYIEDNPAGRRSEAASPGPTKEECQAACPEGWELYEESPYWRARKKKRNTFDNSRKALELFKATAADRAANWGRVESNDDVFAAEDADRVALTILQGAFWEDTKEFNSREHCKHVSEAFIERMVEMHPPIDQ